MIRAYFLDARTALGIAVFPMLCLGAAGYRDDVLIPVVITSWVTAFLGLYVGKAQGLMK